MILVVFILGGLLGYLLGIFNWFSASIQTFLNRYAVNKITDAELQELINFIDKNFHNNKGIINVKLNNKDYKFYIKEFNTDLTPELTLKSNFLIND